MTAPCRIASGRNTQCLVGVLTNHAFRCRSVPIECVSPIRWTYIEPKSDQHWQRSIAIVTVRSVNPQIEPFSLRESPKPPEKAAGSFFCRRVSPEKRAVSISRHMGRWRKHTGAFCDAWVAGTSSEQLFPTRCIVGKSTEVGFPTWGVAGTRREQLLQT